MVIFSSKFFFWNSPSQVWWSTLQCGRGRSLRLRPLLSLSFGNPDGQVLAQRCAELVRRCLLSLCHGVFFGKHEFPEVDDEQVGRWFVQVEFERNWKLVLGRQMADQFKKNHGILVSFLQLWSSTISGGYYGYTLGVLSLPGCNQGKWGGFVRNFQT